MAVAYWHRESYCKNCMQDACADVGPANSVDLSIQTYSSDGVPEDRIEFAIHETGLNCQAFGVAATIEERVLILASPTPSPQGSTTREVKPISDGLN